MALFSLVNAASAPYFSAAGDGGIAQLVERLVRNEIGLYTPIFSQAISRALAYENSLKCRGPFAPKCSQLFSPVYKIVDKGSGDLGSHAVPANPVRRGRAGRHGRDAVTSQPHLIKNVDLNHIEISEEQIAAACEQFGLTIETWRQQAQTFKLMQKVYEKRSAIRGPQPVVQPVMIWNPPSEYSDPNDPFSEW